MNPEQTQNQPPRRSMKADMPQVFAWVQDLRAAFGADAIDPQIRAAIHDGLPTFHASEGGHTVGVALPAIGRAFSAAELVIIPPQKDAHAKR